VAMALIILTYMARGSMIKALIMMVFGLALSTVGTDLVSGMQRFTFGTTTLVDGIGLIPLAMGLFGIAEVLRNLEVSTERGILEEKITNLMPNWNDWKRSIGPICRGILIGFPLGVLPGGGAVVSTFVSYSVEVKISRHPEEFGKGAIEGVAGPETANNAAAGGAFVPLLALGIPPNPVMALLLGGLILHGLTPGPLLITQNPDLFWGVICSMYIGNAMLLVLNLPLIGMWVRILKIPYRILMPLILLFCLIGVYNTNYNTWDIFAMTLLGVVGFVLNKYNYELAPMILAFVLGPLIEFNFRQSLIMSGGSFSIFVTRPISGVALGIAALLLFSSGFSVYRKTKKQMDEMSED
jgi:putative tricarboxylic transport membrane protein